MRFTALEIVSLLSALLGCLLVSSCASSPVDDTEDVVSYAGYQLWTVQSRNELDQEKILKIRNDYDLEVWKVARSVDSSTDFVVPPDFQSEIRSLLEDAGISFNVSISDMQEAIANENPVSEDDELVNRSPGRLKRFALGAYIQFFPADAHKMDWSSYHRIDDIYGYLRYLAETYPNLVQLTSIGSSSEGRPLQVVRISASTSISTPAIWIDGGIHAREWISPAVATYIIQQLVENPANERLITNLVWYIMPVMNPDGYEYTHTNNRLWRKTRSKNPGSCRGADPNRNFGFNWCGKGTSTNACSDVYCGRVAFSEPETRAVSSFIQARASRIKVYLTLHSYGQYVLIPWGYDVAYPSDYNDMKDLARKFASKLQRYKYTVGNSAELLYPAAGGSDDWAKSIGIKYSYTIELTDTGNYGFILPASQIKPVCEDFFPAIEVFANQAASM